MNTTYMRRNSVAVLLMISIIFSLIAPTVGAKILDSINRGLNKMGSAIRKGVNWMNNAVDKGRGFVIGTAAVGSGLMMGLGGAIIGGLCFGPVGLIAGAVGGYFLGKFLTKSILKSNLPMIVGGVIGGALTATMGLPAILCGVFIGAVAGRFLAKGKIGNDRVFNVSSSGTPATAGAPSANSEVLLREDTTAMSTNMNAQQEYQHAYKMYVEATQKGDSKAAQQWLKAYQEAAKKVKATQAR